MTKIIASIVLGVVTISGFIAIAMYGTPMPDFLPAVFEFIRYTLIGLSSMLALTGLLYVAGHLSKSVWKTDGNLPNMVRGAIVLTITLFALLLPYTLGRGLCNDLPIQKSNATTK